MKQSKTFEELIKNPEFILRQNIELALMHLLIDSGIKEADVKVIGLFDGQITKCKELILKSINKFLKKKSIEIKLNEAGSMTFEFEVK